MHSTYLKILISVVALITSACRPSSQDNFLFDSATDQVPIKVSEQKNLITLRGPTGKKITRVKQVSTSKDQTGTFIPAGNKTYVSLATTGEKNLYDVELTLDTTVTCKNTTTTGVPLHDASTINFSCVNETALTSQLKGACKELSIDAATAEYDEKSETCNCLKRTTDKLLKYSAYFGKVSTFKVECANTATREQLKTICTEIKDKQCPTCIVGTLSCECSKKVTLVFDEYTQKVDMFRDRCEEPKTLNPVDATLTNTQQLLKFETDCKRLGTLPTDNKTLGNPCTCTNGKVVLFDDWKKDQDTLIKSCQATAQNSSDVEKAKEFEKVCNTNNGSFDSNANTAKDPVCDCKTANGASIEISFKEFISRGVTTIINHCAAKALP